jgi:Tannase and feruloyl esterase
MGALERWRESNIAPTQITAMHSTKGVVEMVRPLCPYPQVAVYKGERQHKRRGKLFLYGCSTELNRG